VQRTVRTICLLLAISLAAIAQTAVEETKHSSAQENIKKPLVLVVYADWCPYCQNLKPVLVLLNERYRGRIRYEVLDVTSKATTAKARERARALGLEKFFDENYVSTSLVVITDPSGREVFRAVHDSDFHHYEAVLEKQVQPKSKE